MCVSAHTHTHGTYGVLGCEPRGLEETLGGPKNKDGLNLSIYVFVYVYKVHMCMYMLGVGMRSWTNYSFDDDCFSYYK